MARLKVALKGRSIIEILNTLSEANVRKAVAPRAALKIQTLVKQQFAKQQDPYGKRWKRKKIRDGKPVLTGETRQLRRNIDKTVTPRGFGLTAATEYASFHQSGTRNMPQRKIFPTPLEGLPRKWKKELRPVVVKALDRLVR